MLLILVRHGQTKGNIERRIQGHDDPLTDVGRSQAHAVARHIAATYSLTHLYASPLLRAFETATIIGQATHVSPVAVPALAEIDAGHAVGALWDDWRAQNPKLAETMAQPDRSLDAGWAGGETGWQFGSRVISGYREIVTRHIGRSDVVVAVGHGGSLAWIAALAFGDSLEIWPGARSGFHNCSISELRIDVDGQARPGLWNRIDHLAEQG